MNAIIWFRRAVWVLIVLLGGYLAWATLDRMLDPQGTTGSRLAGVQIGGPFTAMTTEGKTITQRDMIGRPHAVFFGFTHCPDVCPTTLYEAGLWLQKLGPEGDKFDVYFVTVDPQRDDAKTLGQYLTAFDKRITGITGSQAQIDDLVKKWRVFAQREETDDGYLINHTASTFLMQSDGSFFGTIAYGEDIDTAVAKLKRLAGAS